MSSLLTNYQHKVKKRTLEYLPYTKRAVSKNDTAGFTSLRIPYLTDLGFIAVSSAMRFMMSSFCSGVDS